MKKILTLENAKQFIEDCNLQEEFKEWAEGSTDDLDYLILDFASASDDQFEEWAKENLDYEPEDEDDGDYLDDDTSSYDEVEKDRQALAWEFNRSR